MNVALRLADISDREILMAVIRQLNKDLQVDWHWEPDADLKEKMILKVLEWVNDTMRNRPDHLASVLYRVDVPEAVTKRCWQQSTPDEALCYAILDRELQKVIIRRAYGSGSEGDPDPGKIENRP